MGSSSVIALKCKSALRGYASLRAAAHERISSGVSGVSGWRVGMTAGDIVAGVEDLGAEVNTVMEER